jgi:Rod binding domain-containing protein
MDISETMPINTAALAGLEAPVSKSQQESLDKQVDVAKKFEGMLLHQMFKQVQEGLEAMKQDGQNEEEESDTCGEQYQSMYWSQLADVVGQQGGVGFWKTVYSQVHEQVTKNENPGSLLNEGL